MKISVTLTISRCDVYHDDDPHPCIQEFNTEVNIGKTLDIPHFMNLKVTSATPTEITLTEQIMTLEGSDIPGKTYTLTSSSPVELFWRKEGPEDHEGCVMTYTEYACCLKMQGY